jgi:hypothetical protein
MHLQERRRRGGGTGEAVGVRGKLLGKGLRQRRFPAAVKSVQQHHARGRYRMRRGVAVSSAMQGWI